MTNPLTGWLAFGRFDADDDIFTEASDYQRPVFDVPVGEIVAFPNWTPIGGPQGFAVIHGAIFASETGGHSPLAWWSWDPVWVELPGRWPPMDVRLDLAPLVQYAVNATIGTSETARIDIPRGGVFGRVNGLALSAGCRLSVVGGVLVPRSLHHQKKVLAA